jgi:hypothetical protein
LIFLNIPTRVLRARPKRALFGTFFDVPNLMEVAVRFAVLQPSNPAPRQYPAFGACSFGMDGGRA